MKTLNRTLSLVLVLVMVLGLFGVASAKFTDDETIQYKEAVGVVSGIGAINGYPDGSFGPTGSITREEAAKLITYAILGPDLAATLTVSGTDFTDVDAGRWSAPFISYLVSKGIINGMGDGTFDPTGNVTGYQIAKMLLVAAGYGKNGEYVGTSWELNVAVDAGRLDIFTGSKIASRTAPATREEAALYVFNGLTKIEQVAWSKSDEIYKQADGGTDAVVNNSIMLDVYKLATPTPAVDSFGRPGVRTWTYKGNTISEENTLAPAVTYTKAVKTGTIYSDLKLKSGVTGTDVVKANVTTNGAAASDDLTIALNGATVVGGNGIVTEVYTDSSGTPTHVVMVQPTIGKVTDVQTKKNAEGSTYTQYTVGTGDTFATTATYDVYTNALNNETDTAVINGTIAKGDFVTFYKGNAGPTYFTLATIVTGKLTAFSSATGMYTIEGQTYALSAATGNKAPEAYNTTATYAIDAYGYVVRAVTVTVDANYLHVLKAAEANVLEGTVLVKSIVADVVKADGTTAKITVAKVDDAAATEANTVPALYTYKVNAKGSYELTTKSDATNDTLSPKSHVIASGKSANNLTKFIIANWTKEDGTDVVTGTVNVITGYTNIPEMKTVVGSYIDADNNGVAEVVFIYSKAAAGTALNYAYYLGTYSTDGTDKSYDFIVNGAKTTIDNVTDLPAKGLVSIDADNKAAAISFGSAVELDITGKTDGIYPNKPVSFDNGLLKVDGTVKAAASSTVPVYVIDSVTGAVAAKTLADLATAATGDAVVIQNGTAVTAVYVITK